MAWNGSRYKTFSEGTQFTPIDANTFQDLYLRPSGIQLNDLSGSIPLPPLGTIVPYSAGTDPNALWLVCDGRAISRTAYSGLFAVISTLYGAGDGSTTFNIPNMKDRVAIHKSTDARFDTVGEQGGEGTHPLNSNESPVHVHSGTSTSDQSNGHVHQINQITILYAGGPTERRFFVPGGGIGSGSGLEDTAHIHFFTTANAGSSTAHQNMQPYLVTTHIIRAL